MKIKKDKQVAELETKEKQIDSILVKKREAEQKAKDFEQKIRDLEVKCQQIAEELDRTQVEEHNMEFELSQHEAIQEEMLESPFAMNARFQAVIQRLPMENNLWKEVVEKRQEL